MSVPFDIAVAPHMTQLQNRARYLCRYSTIEADDVFQDAMLRAWRVYDTQFVQGSNLYGWLYTVITSVFFNEHKKMTRQFHDSLDEMLATTTYEPTDDHDLLDVGGVFSEEVRLAFRSMSIEFQTVIYLVDIEGYTYDAAAEVMGCPIGTVMSRVQRGRNKMKESIVKYNEEVYA